MTHINGYIKSSGHKFIVENLAEIFTRKLNSK